MTLPKRRVQIIIATLGLSVLPAPVFALSVSITFSDGTPAVVIPDNGAQDLNAAANIIQFNNAAGPFGFPSQYAVVQGTVDLDASNPMQSVLRMTNLTIQRLAGDAAGAILIRPVHSFAVPPKPALQWDHIDFSWQRPGAAAPGANNTVVFQGYVDGFGVGGEYAVFSVGGIDPEAYAHKDGPEPTVEFPPWDVKMVLEVSIPLANAGDQVIIPTSAEVGINHTAVPALGLGGMFLLGMSLLGLVVVFVILRQRRIA